MLIHEGIVLVGRNYNSDFSLSLYVHDDVLCQHMNFQGEKWSSGSGIEHLKGLRPELSCKIQHKKEPVEILNHDVRNRRSCETSIHNKSTFRYYSSLT